MDFLYYLCYTWSRGQHLVDTSIAPVSKSLTIPNLYAIIPCELPIILMGFSRLGGAFPPQLHMNTHNAS
jgi:hypothetical protein